MRWHPHPRQGAFSLAAAALVAFAVALAGSESAEAQEASEGSTSRAAVRAAALASAARRDVGAVTASSRTRTPVVIAPRSKRHLPVHLRRGGPVVGWLAPQTGYGSPRRVWVLARRGAWLLARAEEVGVNRLFWTRYEPRRMRIVRLSRWVTVRRLSGRMEIWRGGRRERSMAVSVGQYGSATPVGHFSITDRISRDQLNPVYGQAAFVLNAHQPRSPAWWSWGNRLAIHGSTHRSQIGGRNSAGCVRALPEDLDALSSLPLGTPVVVVPN